MGAFYIDRGTTNFNLISAKSGACQARIDCLIQWYLTQQSTREIRVTCPHESVINAPRLYHDNASHKPRSLRESICVTSELDQCFEVCWDNLLFFGAAFCWIYSCRASSKNSRRYRLAFLTFAYVLTFLILWFSTKPGSFYMDWRFSRSNLSTASFAMYIQKIEECRLQSCSKLESRALEDYVIK